MDIEASKDVKPNLMKRGPGVSWAVTNVILDQSKRDLIYLQVMATSIGNMSMKDAKTVTTVLTILAVGLVCSSASGQEKTLLLKNAAVFHSGKDSGIARIITKAMA